MFLRKKRSCEYRHCRCLARIVITLNYRSVFGQIQYKKPPEHLCLLNRLLQLVLVRVLTLSCYMIGVIFIFQSLCQKKTFAWCLHHVCLSLIHARIQANKLLITAQPIWNLRTLASAEMNKRRFLQQASPTLSPQFLFLFPFLRIPSRRLLRRAREISPRVTG